MEGATAIAEADRQIRMPSQNDRPKIKIMHLINSLDAPGGAELMLYRLLARMDQRRFEHVVVQLIPGRMLVAEVQRLGVPVYALGLRPHRPSPRALLQLLRILRREQPTILQTWLYHADLLGVIAAKLARVPIHLWNIRASNIDTARYHPVTAITIRICAWLSRLPHAIIVNSKAGQTFHTQLGYRAREWVLISNGLDTDTFKPDPSARAAVREELGVAKTAPLIGLIARYDPMKDHPTFLRAAGILKGRHPEVQFVLVGAGVAENSLVARLIDEEGLRDNIHLLGVRRDIPRITAALDIATSSSAYGEGFSNVLGESMACGTPCVATDVGDSAFILGDTGTIVPPKDPAALAQAWEGLLALSPAEREARGQRARQRIVEHFEIDAITRRYEELYERLIRDAAEQRRSAANPAPRGNRGHARPATTRPNGPVD